LVGYGGEAFPSLIIVLQGYGVSTDLVGTTFVSKSRNHGQHVHRRSPTPPSAASQSASREQDLALADNGNLCKSKLAMRTEFVTQSGVKINQPTPIIVTGCADQDADSGAAVRGGAEDVPGWEQGQARRLPGKRPSAKWAVEEA
jgi:hypothetical protein